MKTTLLTIALTAASLPLTFAAQTKPAAAVPAKAQAQSSSTVAPKTTTKKHSSKKAVKKAAPKFSDSTGAAAVKK